MEGAPVSVVIPFYDGHETIQRAVDSLERQTLQPAEIVIVDDGSPTSRFDPASVSTRIPLRSLTHDENRGIPAARNTGIRGASQPWIGFLDQDDEWAGDKLERQWRVVEEEGSRPVVIFGRLLMETATEAPQLRPPRRAIGRVEAGGRAAVRAFLRHGNVLPFVTLLAPREVYERYGYLDESLRGGADDTEMVLRLVGEGVPFRFDAHGQPEAWSVAHRHTGRNFSDHAPRWVADQLVFLPRLAARYPAVAAFERALLARAHYTLGRHHDRREERRAAVREYGAAIRRAPLWWRPWVAAARTYAPAPVRGGMARAWAALESLARERPRGAPP